MAKKMSDDVIPLNEIGKIETIKVYNQAYVDKQQKRIVELEKENAELKMQLEEWKKCFLACSSPFCSKHFPTVESSGVLGNMEKKE